FIRRLTLFCFVVIFLTLSSPPAIFPLSLHDALPISFVVFALLSLLPGDVAQVILGANADPKAAATVRSRLGLDLPWPQRYWDWRSEEHTSELQSRFDLVCRLLLEKKKHENNNSGIM